MSKYKIDIRKIGIAVILCFAFPVLIYPQSVITNLNGDNVSFTEGGAAVLIDNGSDAVITDDGSGYDTGNLTLSIGGAEVQDDLIIRIGVGVELSAGMTEGSTVTVSGTLIGSIAIGGNGQNGTNLIITLNASADDALLATLIHNLTYANDSDDPISSRPITLTVTNAVSAVSLNNDITVSVTGVNDAPTLSSTSENPAFTEDGAAVNVYSGTTVATIESGQTITELILTVTNGINGADEILSIDGSDVALTNGNSLITVTNSMNVNVSLAGNTATVTISKVVGISAAEMQTLINGIKYQNNNNTPDTNNRIVTITSIKDNGGTANGGSDTTNISISSTITVTAANDAPILDNSASPAFASIPEDIGNPVNGSIANSVLVSSLIDEGGLLNNYTDPEGDLPGIAVVGVNSGVLWYTVNGGTNWTELGGIISATNALVLFADADTRVYFKPNSNVSGDVNNAITFKAWDRTSGNANGTAAINTTSGTSFSTNTDNASISITDINDPPALSATPNDPIFTEGDAAVDLFSGVTFSTVESGQNITELIFRLNNISNGMNEKINVDGSDVGLSIGDSVTSINNSLKIMVENLDTINTWTYVTVTKAGGFSSAVAQDIIENLSYRNVSSAITNSTRKFVILSATDDGGTANGGSDTKTYLDSTIITLVGINNQPVLDAAKSPEFNGVPPNINDPVNGSTLYSTLVSDLVQKTGTAGGNELENYSDPDNDLPGMAVISVNAQGTLWYSINAGTNWTELAGVVSDVSSLVLYADNNTLLYYKPDNGISGAVTDAITFKAWDRTSGAGNGTTGVNTAAGTSFSVASDDVEITIADINYPPTLSAAALNPNFTEGGTAKDIFDSINAATPEAGQSLLELKLTLSNVINGADEKLLIDGTTVELTNGNSLSTSTNSMTVEVSFAGNTAEVTISKASGVSSATINNIIDGITYINTNNNPGDLSRVVTLTSLKDDGGSANGSDTGTFNIASTITMLPINEPPVIANLSGDNSSLVAGGSAIKTDVNTAATVSNTDSPDNYEGSITITQTSGTVNGTWSFDGNAVKSGADGVIASSEPVYVWGIQIGAIDNVNDGINGNDLTISLNENSTHDRVAIVLNNLMYFAPNGVGLRSFSLTLDDGDGNLNGGDSDVGVSFTVSVTQNPPVISNLNGDSKNFVKGAGEITLDENDNASVGDPDSPNFDTGNLTVLISSGMNAAEDELGISTSGNVALSAGVSVGSNVSVDGTNIGTISSDGKTGNNLVITFNINSTLARVTTLLRNITYNNNNAVNPDLTNRHIDFKILDASAAGGALSQTSTVEVVLNSAPTTSGIADIEVASGSANTNIDLTLSFDDTDDGAAGLNYSVQNISNAALFTSVYIAGHTLVLDYGLSTNGISFIKIRATDTGGFYIETEFKVTVGTVTISPLAPVVTINTGGSVYEGATLTITSAMLKATDQSGDTSAVTYTVTGQPRHGVLSLGNTKLLKSGSDLTTFIHSDLLDGKIKYINDGGETTGDTISFTVSDNNGNTGAENYFIITVINVNDTPVITSLPAITMFEDLVYDLSITDWYKYINDPDDEDSTLAITVSCNDQILSLNKISNTEYSISAPYNYHGTSSLKVMVSDGEFSVEKNVDVIISAVNDLPAITDLPGIINLSCHEISMLSLFDFIEDTETPDSLLTISFSSYPDSLLTDYKSATGVLFLCSMGTFIGQIELAITVTDQHAGVAISSININVTPVTTDINKSEQLPTEFSLSQNYPNPFNPTTRIRFGLPETAQVTLKIYDVLGREIETLINSEQHAGYYEYNWNAVNFSSGIYFFVLTSQSQNKSIREIRKMLLIK